MALVDTLIRATAREAVRHNRQVQGLPYHRDGLRGAPVKGLRRAAASARASREIQEERFVAEQHRQDHLLHTEYVTREIDRVNHRARPVRRWWGTPRVRG